MENLVQNIIKFDTLISAIAAIIILLAISYIFYSRSGSTYSLYYRLWSLFVGDKKFYDENLETYMQERKDLDKFNAVFNTEAKTKTDLLRFHTRITKHGIDIKKISESKGNFDFYKLKMGKPSLSFSFITFLFSVGVFLFSLVIVALGVSDKAMLKFHDEEPWVLINHEMAKPAFSKYKITPETCKKDNYDVNKINRLTKLSPNTIEVICHSFDSKDDAKTIDKYIAGQKGLPWIAVLLLFVAFRIFIFSIRRFCARDYRGYLKNQYIKSRKAARYTVN